MSVYPSASVGVRPSEHPFENRTDRSNVVVVHVDVSMMDFFATLVVFFGRSCVLYGCIACSWAALKGGIGISRRGGMGRNGTRAFFFDDDRDFLTSRDSKKRRRRDTVRTSRLFFQGVVVCVFVLPVVPVYLVSITYR